MRLRRLGMGARAWGGVRGMGRPERRARPVKGGGREKRKLKQGRNLWGPGRWVVEVGGNALGGWDERTSGSLLGLRGGLHGRKGSDNLSNTQIFGGECGEHETYLEERSLSHVGDG